jgi:hypothetical protein
MQKCPNCSAPLQDLVEQCNFCGTTTDRGVEVRQRKEQQSEADRRLAQERSVKEEGAARARAQPEVDAAGKWALVASLVGMVVCCFFPVGPVMGIVFGLRSRRLAQQYGLPGATLGTAGLALGVLGLGLAVAMWILVAVMGVQESKHKLELKAQLQNVTATQLDLKTACALTELELLSSRYQEFTNLEEFECAVTGDLEQNGEDAVLRDTHFVKNSHQVEVFTCFHYRKKWTVSQVRGDDDCSAPKEPKGKAKQPE